jgi:antitoxin VapB
MMVEGGTISTMEEHMALNIKDAETHELARELAHLTQTSISTAVKEALRSALERRRKLKTRNSDTLVADLDAIALHCAALPVLDTRPADDIVGYDDRGAPA